MHKHVAKEYHLFDLVYLVNIVLVVGCKVEAVKLLKKEYKVDLDFEGEFATGFTNMINGNVFIWLEKFDKSPSAYSDFVHEMFHATTYVLGSRDVKFKTHNDEPYAYYLGFLIRQFLERLKAK
jgi:hypothetical protein